MPVKWNIWLIFFATFIPITLAPMNNTIYWHFCSFYSLFFNFDTDCPLNSQKLCTLFGEKVLGRVTISSRCFYNYYTKYLFFWTTKANWKEETKENGKVYAPIVRVSLKFLAGNEKAPIVYGFFSRLIFPNLFFTDSDNFAIPFKASKSCF